MSSRTPALRSSGEPSVELVSLTWERIQVIIRLRPAEGRRLDPGRLRLRMAGAPTSMPPTRAWLDGGDVVLRFNVMHGPGRMPLAPGSWLLTAEADDPHQGAWAMRLAPRVATQAWSGAAPFSSGQTPQSVQSPWVWIPGPVSKRSSGAAVSSGRSSTTRRRRLVAAGVAELAELAVEDRRPQVGADRQAALDVGQLRRG